MKKLNKKPELKAKKLKQWLISQEVVKEYQKYEKMIKENHQLKQQEQELKKLQKEIVNKKHTDDDCNQLIHDYEILKEAFYNHPIVNNYLLLKEEVNQLVQQINQIINSNIND